MINSAFFSYNRRQLRASYPTIVSGYGLLQASNDSAAPFQQEANFWYLTGIEAPGWYLIMEKDKSWLVAPKSNDRSRVFDGELSHEEAKKISGVDAVISSKEGRNLIITLAGTYNEVATLGDDPRAKYYDFSLNPAPKAMYRQLKKQFREVRDCRLELAKLRAVKRPEEVEAMRKAISLTVDAFKEVKKRLASFEHEYEVEAEFSYYFRKNGAKGHAYEPIVAGGKNACTLHYIANQARLPGDGLLLLDIGARVGGYAADITRTYALGTPTKRQRDVHEAVESAHKEIISLLKPGLSVVKYQGKVDEIMKQKITNLGLLKKPQDYRKYFPHAISHGLGIDVHDALGRPEKFKEGMVLTVEPGIYIPEEGIGVRIEDDILITKGGHENLSAALPTSL